MMRPSGLPLGPNNSNNNNNNNNNDPYSNLSREELIRQLQLAQNQLQQVRHENQMLHHSRGGNFGNNLVTGTAGGGGGNGSGNLLTSTNLIAAASGGGGGGSHPNSHPNSRPTSANSNTSSNNSQFRTFGANQQMTSNSQKYSVSMNVLVISGLNDHKCRTMPLQSVLERNAAEKGGVPYVKEADTPINAMMASNAPHHHFNNNQQQQQQQGGSQNPFARHSIDLTSGTRFSEQQQGQGGGNHSRSSSGNAFDFGGSNSNNNSGNYNPATAHRLSALAGPQNNPYDNNNQSGDQQQQQQGSNNNRPSGLSSSTLGQQQKRQTFQLDADALVSNHTLQAFARSHIDVPLSPQSMTATNMLKYLIETFAYNGFQHEPHPRQLEAVGRSLISICTELERILTNSPCHPEIVSPVYCFGDIHGNFSDLHYFCSTIINFGDMRFVPLNMLFLGDYVDRGPHGVEVVAFLFALKVLAPHKVTLLRGNHEDTLVNGDLNLYKDTSFRYQCRSLFGELLGEEVWLKCNRVFAYLPLTASIDKKIFCTHGGLPRFGGGQDNRMEMLCAPNPPRLDSFFQVPENESRAQALYRQMACDVCWSDPAEDERLVDEHGFGNNPRGAGVILFGGSAVDRFLSNFGFEYIFRAHQEKSDGLKISKNARVVTVFSTSGYVGHQNGAGVVYVAEGRIRLIIKEHEDEEKNNNNQEQPFQQQGQQQQQQQQQGQQQQHSLAQH